jgi:hypothetical protein
MTFYHLLVQHKKKLFIHAVHIHLPLYMSMPKSSTCHTKQNLAHSALEVPLAILLMSSKLLNKHDFLCCMALCTRIATAYQEGSTKSRSQRTSTLCEKHLRPDVLAYSPEPAALNL